MCLYTFYRCDVVCARVYITVCPFCACIFLYLYVSTLYLCDLVSAMLGCQPQTAPAVLVDKAEHIWVAVLCQHISTCPVCAGVCVYVCVCVCVCVCVFVRSLVLVYVLAKSELAGEFAGARQS